MKKLNKKTTIAVFAALCFTSLISLFYSCEVGLGSAVDTQPPSVSISYPPSLSVIRDSFVFAGNWNDDRTIKGVFVEVYQIKDDQKTIVFKDQAETTDKIDTEEEKKDGTWSITLNNYDAENPEWYNGWEFCDGDYEVQVYAKDNAEQVSSVASRTFSIDNTAPILLLTNPTSAGNDSSPAFFGQIVQLTGYFYESTGKISNLVVSFYDESGNAILDSKFTNITSMSDSSPLVVAKYFSSKEERTENSQIFYNYAKLIGENQIELFDQGKNVENKKIYFSVTASDNAREFKTVGDNGTGEGNLSKQFYRGTTSMQNLISGDGGIENFSLNDFAQFKNGTSNKYTGFSQTINQISNSARSISVTNQSTVSVADYISNNDSKNGDPVYLTFVLNPKNNPQYSFGGYELIQTTDTDNFSEHGYKFVYAGSSLPLSISVGTDNKNISTHTVSVYRIDKTKINLTNPPVIVDEEFFKDQNNFTNGFFELMHTWDEEVVERFNSWSVNVTDQSTVTDSDANTASLSKQFTVKDFIKDHEYEFYVVGQDITGSSIISTNTKGYGFCGKVSETAPQINVESGYTQNAIINEKEFKGTGTGDKTVLFFQGTINTERELIDDIIDSENGNKYGFGYNLKIVKSNTAPLEIKHTIQRGTTPPAATDKTSNYCYKDTNTNVYNWRFTTAEFASDPNVIDYIREEDTYELSLELMAYNGVNSKHIITRTFTLDTQPPHPELSEMTVAVEKEANKYWINPKNQLIINGLVTDNLSTAKACKTWWKLIALSDSENEVSGSERDNASDSDTTGVNKWNFTIPAGTIAKSYYGAHLYIYSQDVAGNEYKSAPITLIFDTTAPAGIHKIDAKGKDVVFRIGNNDNDDIDENSTNPTWNSNLDTNVGGKYSSETYGNSETIDIKGYFDDGDGCQVDLVYYKVFHTQPSETDASGFLSNYKTQKDGTFSLIAPVSKRVFYTHQKDSVVTEWDTGDWAGTDFGGGKYYLNNVKYNFDTTISGLTKGVNYLMLIAVDKVGNAALESVPVTINGTTTTYPDYIINVDTTAPSVPKEKIYAPTLYYNSKNEATDNLFKVYGIAKDEDSGIRDVGVVLDDTEFVGEYDKTNKKTILYRVTKNANNEEEKTEVGSLTLSKIGTVSLTDASFNGDALSEKNALWSIELKKEAFTGISSGDSASISVKVTDNAGTGNSITRPVANVMIDTDGPSVEIKSPENGAEVNGTITISVSANDGTGSGISVKNPVIEKKVVTESKTTWETLSVNQNFINGTGSFELVTTDFDDNKPVSLRISFEDKVGNIGYYKVGNSEDFSEYTLNVNQDKDRPLITLSQLSKNTETTLRVKNVYGSVSDDDGTVQKMWYWSKQKNGAVPTEAPTLTDNKGWTPISVNGGSWSVDSTEEDGETTWYFAVADAQNGIFTTIGTDTLKQPKLKYSDVQDPVDGTAAGVSFKYDTNPPTPTYLGLYRAPAETSTTAAEICANDNDENEANDVNWKTENGISFGKNFNVLYAKIIVEESTGMKALEGNSGSIPSKSPISISYKDLTFEKIQYKEIAATETETAKYIYYLGPITMNSTESCEFKITVEDAVGNKGYISRNIIVDNTAPETINRVNPKASSEANGTFVYRGNVSDNDGGSGVETIEWYIPKDTETNEKAEDIEWKSATLSAGWEIDFSGVNNLSTIIGYTVSGSTSTVDDDFNEYQIESTGVYQLPVWFRITDAVGNVGYNKENSIKYNPNTDRPSVQINNPEHNKVASIGGKTINYVIMGGGSARISGSADDNEGIEAVYLQFDLDGDGYWDNGVKDLTADLAALPTAQNQMMSYSPWTYDKVEEILSDASIYGFGIKVGITKNWSYTFDLSKDGFPTIIETATGEEPNITYSYSGKTIKVRAISVDNDTENGKLTSAPSDVINISVSNNIPLFNNLKLKQIVNDTVKVEMDYIPGKYLTGNNWYITGDVSATGGISAAEYTGTTKNADAKNDCFSQKGDSSNQFDMKIPIVPDENGKWDVSITVYDGNETPKQNIQQIQINIDNTPPRFEDQYPQSDQLSNGTVKHFLGGYGSKGKSLTPSVPFADTDGLSSIWGKVTDNGSGFSKAVFYFKRFEADGISDPRVYNPFGAKNSNRTVLNSSKAVGKVYIDSSETGDNLPALYVKTESGKMNVSRPSEYAIKVELNDNTLTGVVGNTNIRKGGLIKIGGIYRIITSVESNGTINFDTSCDKSYTEAEIIYAMVVDTSGESINNDVDSDGLIENISTVSSTTTWNAALPTSTIPDGPIELHVVVFDEAGNSAHGYTKTAISNNPLRITKVMLGTDLNRNGRYETASEFEKFYAITNSRDENDLSKGKEIWDLDTKGNGTSYFIAKKDLAVISEFVGGTGDIYYAFTKSIAKRTTPQTVTPNDSTNKLKSLDTIIGTVNAEGSGNTVGQLVINNNTIGAAGEDDMRVFSFTFWDSTESSSVGTNSSWSVLNAMIHQDLTDGTSPIAKVNPFRWVDKNNNSTEWDNERNALGHIELEDDWTAVDSENNKLTGWDGKTDGTTYLDSDPKVSGKIKIEGTAFDETRLSSITVTFGNKSATVNYSEGWLDGATDEDFVLTVDDSGPAQNGHSITWKLVVDTSKVVTDKIAEKNVIVEVSAKDASNNQNTVGTKQTNTTTQTAYYRMDIVPYITSIETTLSKLKKNNPSVYARTALGHYAVSSNEVLKIQGFNISGGTLKFKKSETENVTATYDETEGGYLIPSTAISGSMSISVNGVEALNNVNNNQAYGTAYETAPNVDSVGSVYKDKKFYNRQPNGDNNNLLTDDVVLDVWEINSNVAQAQGSAYITEPIMKINPVSGMLNFAYNSGPANFSMANGTTTSHTTWVGNLARMTTAGFAVDENGVTHGITVGLDTNPSSGSAGRMQYVTSKWGTVVAGRGGAPATQENYEGIQSSRFETIGAPKGTYNGVTYSEWIFAEDRFASPSLVTSIHKDSEDVEHTYIFLAYYDDLNGQIRFRYGDLAETTEHTVGRTFGGFVDQWNYGSAFQGTGDGTHKSFNTNTRPNDYSVIASTEMSGTYLSIDIIKGSSVDDDVIVATWQDSTNGKWYYAYKKKPCTDNDLGITRPGGAVVTDGYWSDPILLASNAGEDCHISVDPRGGVHIAAYDGAEANLLYAYFANYTDSVPQIVTVDSYAFTGEHLTLDTAFSDDGNYVVPLIGYYMDSAKRPKIARLDNIISAIDGTGTIPTGVDENDVVTGKWETAIIPTESKYADNYAYSHVNVGVWKDSTGKIKKSNRPASGTTKVDMWEGDNKKVADETNGYFWGNGTDNPVLGYAIKVGTRGYIETAQMR